jgi:ELWxxDGT repeat protein
LLQFGTSVIFSAYLPEGGQALFKSDGTTEGAIGISPTFSVIREVVVMDDVIYFSANGSGAGYELWVSDGTLQGTFLVRDIWPGSSSSEPRQLFGYNGTLYFSARTQEQGDELWICRNPLMDGEASVTLLKDINPFNSHSSPGSFRVFNNEVYFEAVTEANGRELWKTNGTSEGTVMVKDIYEGPEYSVYFNPFAIGTNAFYFFASHPTVGAELWKSDGTTEGTVLVKDIVPGVGSVQIPANLIVSGGSLYFTVFDSERYTLWKSDGTEDGTLPVFTFAGDETAGPSNFIAYNNKILFYYNRQIWKSEGGSCNTVPVTDNSAIDVSPWEKFVLFNNKLFFLGSTAQTGEELFYYDFTNINTPSCTQTVAFNELLEKTYGEEPFSLDAFSSSGLPVQFTSSNPQVAEVNGNIVTIVGAGQVSIIASQEGDINYGAASAERMLVVNKASASITIDGLFHTYNGEGKSATITTEPANISGISVVYKQAGSIVQNPINAGSYDVEVTLENANYLAQPVSGVMVLEKAIASIVLSELTQTYNGNPRAVSISTDPPGVDGISVVYKLNGEVVDSPTNAGVYDVETSLDNANYSAAPAMNVFRIEKAVVSITLSDLVQTYNGDTHFVSVVTGPAVDGISVVYKQNEEIIQHPTNAGVYDLEVSIDNPNYSAAPITNSFTIQKADQTLGFAPIENQILGDVPAISLVASSSAGLDVIFASDNEGVAQVNGNELVLKGAGSASITASQPGNLNYNPASPISHTFEVKLISALESGSEKSIVLYPNPASDYTTIMGEQGIDHVSSSVTDSSGKISDVAVERIDRFNYLVDLSGLPSGSYIIKIQSGKTQVAKRIIIKN